METQLSNQQNYNEHKQCLILTEEHKEYERLYPDNYAQVQGSSCALDEYGNFKVKKEIDFCDASLVENCKPEEVEVPDVTLKEIYKDKTENEECYVKIEDNCKIEMFDINLEENVDEELNTIHKQPLRMRSHCSVTLNKLPFVCEGDNFVCNSQGCCRSFSCLKKLACHLLSHGEINPCSTRTYGPQKPSGTLMCSEKQIGCNLCSELFADRSKLIQHRINIHLLKSHSQSDLKQQSCHSDAKQYECNLCSKSFSRNSNLAGHLRIHSGEKPYKCDLCGNSFRYSSNLVIHFRTHSDERPYKCILCGKAFLSSSELKRHIRSHSGEKPYKCSLCNKSFSQKPNLTRHLRSHDNEGQYKCKLCSKSFKYNSHLSLHLGIHFDEKLS